MTMYVYELSIAHLNNSLKTRKIIIEIFYKNFKLSSNQISEFKFDWYVAIEI